MEFKIFTLDILVLITIACFIFEGLDLRSMNECEGGFVLNTERYVRSSIIGHLL